jgi:hypothetical protein
MRLLGLVLGLALLVFVGHSLLGDLSGSGGSGLSQFVRSGLGGVCADTGAEAEASGSSSPPSSLALPGGISPAGLSVVSKLAGGNGANLPCPAATTTTTTGTP